MVKDEIFKSLQSLMRFSQFLLRTKRVKKSLSILFLISLSNLNLSKVGKFG